MDKKVCSNPSCKAIYTVEEGLDMGVCCFECYEEMYCHQPEEVVFEKIEL